MTTPFLCRIVMLGVVACAGAGPDDETPFADQIRIPVGSEPAAVLILDVDRDQRPDLVVANEGDGTISVLRNHGRGDFRLHATVPAGEHPADLAPGDFDEDGWVDLLVANHDTDYVTVLFGGRGGFTQRDESRIPVGVSPHPHVVEVVDLNGDGHLDFLVDDREAGALKLCVGQGDGTFRQSGSIDVGGDPYRGMAVRDLDGDGELDVVTPNRTSVAIVKGDGTGAFAPPAELDGDGLLPFSVGIADVNGDGIADLGIGSGEGEGSFVVWLGSPNGKFHPAPGSPYPLSRGPTTVSVADVDGDETEDFLTTSYMGNDVTLFLGGAERLEPVRIGVEGNPWGIAAGDLNDDGLVDLGTANNGSDDISVFLARGMVRDEVPAKR